MGSYAMPAPRGVLNPQGPLRGALNDSTGLLQRKGMELHSTGT